MLLAASALKGYAIEASDGRMGTVHDLLFHDHTWKIRWLVVDTGTWLTGRQVLVHPSAVREAHHDRQALSVELTKAQVEGSPAVWQDQPVSQQMQSQLYDYYGWDPYWSPGSIGIGAMALPFSVAPDLGNAGPRKAVRNETIPDAGDPHLRSIAAVTGYHIHATDGAIGHVENFLIDDAGWDIRYLVVDTRNWWPGQHVLVSPYAVREIDWSDRQIRLEVSRSRVKESPPWDPADMIDQAYGEQLHAHYGWPGYGL